MIGVLLAALLAGVVPVHGTVLGSGPHGTTIVRNDPVTGMLASQARAYRIEPSASYDVGEGIDGFLDARRSPWRLYDATPAGRFAPGMPDRGKVDPIDYGSALPHTRLVDQSGRFLDLAANGRVTLLSFVFTRCPDKNECPTISSKFAYLQQHLDEKRFRLIEMTLDPVYDSPRVLANYARQFGANGREWSIVTGQPDAIQHLLNRFGISSLPVSDANFIHNDKVFVADASGKVADVVQTAAFSPGSLAAQAQHIAGMSSSPLGRFELALVADVVALCGGSQYAGVVLLETLLFLAIAGVAFFILSVVARVLWKSA